MHIVLLSGSIVGTKTRTAMNAAYDALKKEAPDDQVTLIDLSEYDVQFSDGRHFLDYEGDTKYVVDTIMDADALMIGTPIFQASIPGTLKNVFDLLPVDGLKDKVVSMLATAGSSKHFLILEHHLKPILGYMKAQVVQSYVFIEETDFDQQSIVNDDVHFRIERLVQDTLTLAKTYEKIKEEEDQKFNF